ncbi:MFS transporter [Pseudoalteromonas aurantia]|uniref:Major facilitator superfamily (MFS) profile domain-containing protein n=1 Tax=Pseudoalteromonas aurantia 208 TaxID=1314867 RepID=A0ABR9EKP1_9GAMM|nr:MFS transporter [Pseudoalteromonas aurantia]MBE0370820.1 hypothetical protein [Pseudoalteromonas aurantia 208]
MNHIQSNKLFIACCLALTVTAMTFAIRAAILTQLSQDFALTDTELGWVNAMAFLGFPVATVIGGLLYNTLGAKKLLVVAFIGHVIGLALTINAVGFWSLIISSFCIGFANGAVEAGCNPLVVQLYKNNKTTMLNRFHVWFPGGIVIGACVAMGMSHLALSWQSQIAIMFIPTGIYGYLIVRHTFPRTQTVQAATVVNVKSLLSPLFIFMAFCMSLTAVTELGTQQWIERILGASGASPMAIMAMVTGLMAVGRYFAGPLVHALNATGVLLVSAIFATLGIFLMSVASGVEVYIAAFFFALGVTYFWPTMLGFVAEKLPQTGAIGLSLMGGIGMLSVSIWSPVIGNWIDLSREYALQRNLSAAQAELIAGQTTLGYLMIFPCVLIFAFSILLAYQRKNNNFEQNEDVA